MKNEKILVQIFAAPIRFSQDTRGKLNATGRSEDVLNVFWASSERLMYV